MLREQSFLLCRVFSLQLQFQLVEKLATSSVWSPANPVGSVLTPN